MGLTRLSILTLFCATWVAGVLAWGFLTYNVLRLFLLARTLDLERHLRFNPLNVIFYPKLLPAKGLQIRQRIFLSVFWFLGLIAFGFLVGGIAYIVGPASPLTGS